MRHILEFETFTHLNEVGEANAQSYDWKKEVERNDLIEYSFTTDLDTNYLVDFRKESGHPFSWEWSFSAKHKSEDVYNKSETNKGELYRVMATNIEIIRDFVSKLDRNYGHILSFIGIAKDDEIRDISSSQRTILYKRFFSKAFPDFNMEDHYGTIKLLIKPEDTEEDD